MENNRKDFGWINNNVGKKPEENLDVLTAVKNFSGSISYDIAGFDSGWWEGFMGVYTDDQVLAWSYIRNVD